MKEPQFEWDGEFKFSEEELDLIERINKFLSRPLSPRWIYYGLFDVPDSDQQALLNTVLNKARKDRRQLIDRDLVTDDTRNPTIWGSSKDVPEFLSELSYVRDIWQDQPSYLEVWMEDQASLESIVKSPREILQKYRVNARYCKGFNSIGAMWGSFKFFREMEKPIKILYYGDLNPSGWAIPIIVVRQFKEMGLDIELERLALKVEQLKQYDLPMFTKISGDPRRKEFNLTFGFEHWEREDLQPYMDERAGKTKYGKKHLNIDLEKIPIEDFEDLLDTDIQSHLDATAYISAIETEKRGGKNLQKEVDKIKRKFSR